MNPYIATITNGIIDVEHYDKMYEKVLEKELDRQELTNHLTGNLRFCYINKIPFEGVETIIASFAIGDLSPEEQKYIPMMTRVGTYEDIHRETATLSLAYVIEARLNPSVAKARGIPPYDRARHEKTSALS